MKIYTKTGDSGEASLLSGGRRAKSDGRFEAFGNVDELNAVVGQTLSFISAHPQKNKLASIASHLLQLQNELFVVGSHLAADDENSRGRLPSLDALKVGWMEDSIDAWTNDLPPLREFILPGGDPVASSLHLARTVCRRTERETIRLSHAEMVDPRVVIFLNRLSDWFFTAARHANHSVGVSDVTWKKT